MTQVCELFQDIKEQFPIFSRKDLIYLDSAATTQKPNCVIDAVTSFYKEEYGTVHRGVYDLSILATEKYFSARKAVQSFLNAKHVEEIVFTKGTTESINLLANSLGDLLKEGDEVIITEGEHHSNIVPWQLLAKRKKITLRYLPLTDKGEVSLDHFKKMITSKTKLLSIAHIFNALGTINPIEEFVQIAHTKGIFVLIDGAQSAGRLPLDMQQIGCDFFVFSAHKMYGPTGIGVLYGKLELLEKMGPFQGGGDMVEKVTMSNSFYQRPPLRFEAGTPPIAQAIGLQAAISFLQNIDVKNIEAYEKQLAAYAQIELKKIANVCILAENANKCAIVSFVVDDMHPMDVATLLSVKNISLRSGHLCAQPTLTRYGLEASLRISFGVYNTYADIDQFIEALQEVIQVLSRS